MMNKTSSVPMVICMVVVAVLLAGCANLPGQGIVKDAVQVAICESLDSLGVAMAQIDEISADSTTADVKALIGALDAPVQAARSAAEKLNRPELDALFSSYDDLTGKINDLQEGAKLDQAAEEVQNAVGDMQSAVDNASDSMKCSD